MAEFCIGTAQFGMKYGIANETGPPSQKEIYQIVKYAVENNIAYFDTAQSYGKSETLLGNAFTKLDNIKEIKVITKLSPAIQQGTAEEIFESVELSLNKLKLDYIYGFLAHRLETIHSDHFSSSIDKLKDKGMIKKCGVSVYTPNEAMVALENPLVEILQIPFNILDRRWIDEDIFEKAEEKNIQLFFRSIFLQGLIFLNNSDLKKKKMVWTKPYLDMFHKLVSNTYLSPIDISINVLASMAGNNIIIMGVDSLLQLEKNVNKIKNVKIDKAFSENWWVAMPLFPEKLLNPALWN